jgi:hypothetical protein
MIAIMTHSASSRKTRNMSCPLRQAARGMTRDTAIADPIPRPDGAAMPRALLPLAISARLPAPAYGPRRRRRDAGGMVARRADSR